jgi:hypothetical protein
MNSHDPTEIAPLSFGPGLALGLMLIIGLPAEPKAPRPNEPARARGGVGGLASGAAIPTVALCEKHG